MVNKKKKKKKKKGTGKTAIEIPGDQETPPEEIIDAESNDSEESEEDSPKKVPSNRATRVGLPNFAKKTLFRNCENKSSLKKNS